MQGLLKHSSAKVNIKDSPGKGRGVFAAAAISRGQYVMEYKTSEVYPRSERPRHEREYVTGFAKTRHFPHF